MVLRPLTFQAQIAVDCRNRLGEGLVWSKRRNGLLWVDIEGLTLYELSKVHECEQGSLVRQWALPERSGTVALTNVKDEVVLPLEGGLAVFNLEAEGTVTKRLEVGFETDTPKTRPNDGRVDRDGRFVFGGYNEEHRSDGGRAVSGVYRLEAEEGGVLRLLARRFRVANSICFSPSGGKMYFCDSPSRRILSVRYDGGGAAATQRLPLDEAEGSVGVFYAFPDGSPGFPDGATVDSEGGVWSAQFGASRVVRHSPVDGAVDTVVEVPVPNPTCVALGGPDLTTLYITTTRRRMSEAELAEKPMAGGLFKATVPVPGIPEPEYRLRREPRQDFA